MFCITTSIHDTHLLIISLFEISQTEYSFFYLYFSVGTKLAWGIYVYMYANDDNERQRKSSQRAVGERSSSEEKRRRERRKNESKAKEKVKKKTRLYDGERKVNWNLYLCPAFQFSRRQNFMKYLQTITLRWI